MRSIWRIGVERGILLGASTVRTDRIEGTSKGAEKRHPVTRKEDKRVC